MLSNPSVDRCHFHLIDWCGAGAPRNPIRFVSVGMLFSAISLIIYLIFFFILKMIIYMGVVNRTREWIYLRIFLFIFF